MLLYENIPNDHFTSGVIIDNNFNNGTIRGVCENKHIHIKEKVIGYMKSKMSVDLNKLSDDGHLCLIMTTGEQSGNIYLKVIPPIGDNKERIIKTKSWCFPTDNIMNFTP